MTSSDQSSSRRRSHGSTSSSSTHTSSKSPPTLDTISDEQHHSHIHVETPYPLPKHAATWDVATGNSSPNPLFEVGKSHLHTSLPRHMPSLSNPIHTVEDRIANFRFNHAAKAAKRDAKRLAEHNAQDSSKHGPLRRQSPVHKTAEYEEINEDWTERDAQAWADELKKREAARRMSIDFCASWSGGWVPAGEQGHK